MGEQRKEDCQGMAQVLDIPKSILDFSGDFMAVCDLNLKVLYANPAVYTMTGYSPSEIHLDITPELVHHKADVAWVREAFARASRGETVEGTTMLVMKDGKEIDVHQQFFAIRNANGDVSGVGVVIRDITALSEAKRGLLIKSAIIDSSDDFIAATDENLKCTYINPAAYAISGYTPEEMDEGMNTGRDCMYDAATMAKIKEVCGSFTKSGVPWHGESKLFCKDGTVLDVEHKFFPLRDEKGEFIGTGNIMRDITLAKQIQCEADKTFTVMRNILDGLDVAIYVRDLETDEILFINRKMKQTFGLDDDAVGRICWQTFRTGLTERCSFCASHALEQNPNVPVEWEEYDENTNMYVRHTDSIIEWIDGAKVHMQHSTDITDIKKVQQEADNARSIMESIMDNMDTYIYVSDFKTDEILFINKRMKEVFGLSGDIVGQTCWKVLQEGMTERCEFCPNHQLSETPDAVVKWEEHNSVTKRHYSNTDSVINWIDGRQVHMQHSTDVTEILSVQQETKETRDRLETALEASHAGVWEMDFVNNIVTYDAMCAHLFGLNADSHAMPLDECVAHLVKVIPQFAETKSFLGLQNRAAIESNFARDILVRLPNDTQHYIRNYGNTLCDEEGKAIRTIGMTINITQRVQIENELIAAKEAAEEAGRAKIQFLFNMSHEIRTPMNAIIGMTDLVKNEELSARQRRYVNDIQISANALLSTINDILDFSKIDAGKLQLNAINFDLISLLNNLSSMFAYTAQTKGISFAMHIKDELPSCLFGDDIRLRQALINILGNAVKFTKQGGVTMTVWAKENMLYCDIRDTGIGIKREDISKIFGAYNQVDESSNRSITGTGLGLSITQNLIDLMGGTITLESEYGVGTVFHMAIPIVLGDASKLEPVESEVSLIYAPRANVLVVDDVEVNLTVASGMLKLYGIDCDTASGGIEAIEMIAAKKYDIVFMDHMMPEMDGVETTKVLRESYDASTLVIIALTANAVQGAQKVLINAGMNDYLSKPIDKMRLNQILLKWLPADKILKEQPGEKKPESEEDKGTSPLLLCLEQIEEIDIQYGLDLLSGMRDVYEKSLHIFARRLPESTKRLEGFMLEGDLANFAIEVHGLKGSFYNIGAVGLAKKAEALELHAKDGDKAFCEANFPDLLSHLKTFYEKLAAAIAKSSANENVASALGDTEELKERIPVVLALLDDFESDEALQILQDLHKYDYGQQVNEALSQACQFIEMFDYDGAISALSAI